MNAVHTGGLSSFYKYENYVSGQLPLLWMPVGDVQISAVKDTLGGTTPPDPLENLYPADWYFHS